MRHSLRRDVSLWVISGWRHASLIDQSWKQRCSPAGAVVCGGEGCGGRRYQRQDEAGWGGLAWAGKS